MSLLLFHQGNVPIIEDDMKFAKLPLPTDGKTKGWKTNVLSAAGLITIYNQVKNGQIDGIMIVDSHDYGGLFEQRAISTGLEFVDYSVAKFYFSHSYPDVNRSYIEGFINVDRNRAIDIVAITSTGKLFYEYYNLVE